MSFTEQICQQARNLGFDLVGIASIYPVPRLEAYAAWLDRGYHGEMGYMARPDRVERRADPGKIVSGVRSIILVGLNYYPGDVSVGLASELSRGRISNYAWGIDYHNVMMPRLEALADFVVGFGETARSMAYRAYVDTGPVLERAYAARAGLGFIGKNTSLIHPRKGSWLFLGEILVNQVLEPTQGEVRSSCGTCERCLEACPTGALVAPYILDARRCISYLTIELKGAIPPILRSLMGNWIYGCDVCQAVCPWQKFAQITPERSFWADDLDCILPLLSDVVGLEEAAFRQRYKSSPILRIGRSRLLRNAAVALGNWGSREAVPLLQMALDDAEPLVRGHAAWALGCIDGIRAHDILRDALQDERDSYVQEEIILALEAQ